MNHYSQSDQQIFPSKIQSIEDKKTELNGDISYLVKYKDQTESNWASRAFLCTDLDNRRCIQRFQRLDLLIGNEIQLKHNFCKPKSSARIVEKLNKNIRPDTNQNYAVKIDFQDHQIISAKINERQITSQSKKQVSLKQLPGEDFKIVHARINLQGSVDFKVRLRNGNSWWVEGDEIKKEHPQKVIKYYQKRIVWKS